MNFLSGAVVHDQILENGKYMPPVFNDALEQRAKVRLALAFAIPLGEDGRGNSNVAAQFFGVVSAQEKPVKKRGLALRELEILRHLIERIWLRSHSRKGQFTDFAVAVKSPRSAR